MELYGIDGQIIQNADSKTLGGDQVTRVLEVYSYNRQSTTFIVTLQKVTLSE